MLRISLHEVSDKKIIIAISIISIILFTPFFSSNASAQISATTPISGQYANSDYGISMTLPDGWVGAEQKAPQGDLVQIRPQTESGMLPVMMMIMVTSKQFFHINSLDSIYPGSFAMVADGGNCDDPVVTTKNVNGISMSELIENCGTGSSSAKMKEDVIQTNKNYIIISYVGIPSSTYDSDVAQFDTSIKTLQVSNSIEAPEIPGTNNGSTTGIEQSTTTNNPALLTQSNSVQIPSWVKNNAKWWSQNQIGDTDFVNGIQYLISQGILQIPPTAAAASTSQHIPAWIKNTAGWWASGQVSDDEFVKAIQYLISQGIIVISSSSSSSNVQQSANTPQTQTVKGSASITTPNSNGADSVVATIGVGTNPLGVAFDPANGYIYVDNENDNSVSVIDGSSNTLAAGFTNPIMVGHSPYGVSLNSTIYVSNLGSSTVSVIDGGTNTLATGFTNPIPVGSFPNGVVAAPNGNIYVVNNHSNSVSVIDGQPSHSTYNTVIATIPIGTVGTGPNMAAAGSNNGYIYVTSNQGVYVIDTTTNALATGFTNPIQAGSTTGIVVDNINNYIYAANYAAGTVTVINDKTNTVATGFTNPITVGTHPYGVTYDYSDQSIYVANQGSNTVTKISATTTPNVAQTIQVGNQPWGEAYDDKNGCIYVGNYQDGTVSVICSSSKSSTNTGASQNYNFITSWDDNVGLNGGGYNPNLAGVAVDSSGNVYVTEPSEGLVLKFDNNGKFITSWTHEQYVNGGNCPGQLDNPWGIAVSPSNDVYVLDSGNLRIQKFDSNGNFIKEWGNTYTQQNSPNSCTLGNGGSGNGQFAPSAEAGIATDSSGNVYAVDNGNDRIQKFDSNGNFIAAWKITDPVDSTIDLSNPQKFGIAVDQSGNVYLNAGIGNGSPSVIKYSQSANSCTSGTQVGSYPQNSLTINICFVKSWTTNSGYFATGNLSGLAIDSSNNVYLNSGNGGIQKFDSNGNYISSITLETNPSQGLPSGVAVDSSGNIFVVDYSNSKIQKFGIAP